MHIRLAIWIAVCALTCLVSGCFRDATSNQHGIVKVSAKDGDHYIPDTEYQTETLVLPEHKLQIDIFSHGPKTFYFYCNTETGVIRMRSVPIDYAVHPNSQKEIEKIIEEYLQLPEGDRMRLGGGFSEHLIHIGHEGQSGGMTFGETSFLIIGDQDDPKHGIIREIPNFTPDFIYTPCARTAPAPQAKGDSK